MLASRTPFPSGKKVRVCTMGNVPLMIYFAQSTFSFHQDDEFFDVKFSIGLRMLDAADNPNT